MEGAHDGAVGVAGIDAERTVPDVDRDDLVLSDGRARSEREALQRLDDDAHRLLDGRVAKRVSEIATAAGALLLRGGDGRPAPGRAGQGDEPGGEEAGPRGARP